MKHTTLALLGLLLALGAPPQRVRAQDAAQEEQPAPPVDDKEARARAHFQKGVDYYSEGDLAAAHVELQRAYDLQPTYRLLYNLGQIAYEQRDYAGAERYFEEYLAQGGMEIEAPRRIEVEQELERLRGRVADVVLRSNRVDAQLFVDDRAVGRAPLPGPIRLSAGRRTVRAELAGEGAVQRVIDVVGGEPMSVDLTFAGPMGGPRAGRGERDGGGLVSKPAFWTGLATGVLALGAGGMALWTRSEQSKYDDALARRTSRSELSELSDSTEQKALVTDVLLGAAVAGAAVTVVLVLMDDDDAEHAPGRAAIELAPSGVRGAF